MTNFDEVQCNEFGRKVYRYAALTLTKKKYINIRVTISNNLSPVHTSDASISISIGIRSLCASEDNRNISASISIRISKHCVLLMLMLALMSLLHPVRTCLA